MSSVYYSTDDGATWTRPTGLGPVPLSMISSISGDLALPGRIYLATGGRGLFYVDLFTSPPSGTYAAWTALVFPAGSTEEEQATTYDYDGDGLANLLEYALGGLPTQASSPLLRPQGAMLGDELTLTFDRLKSATGVICQIEASTTLEAGSWSAAGVTTEVISEDASRQVIRGRVTLGSPRGFMRLKVIMVP